MKETEPPQLPPSSPPQSTVRHRNSIATSDVFPANITFPITNSKPLHPSSLPNGAATGPTLDLELISLKPSHSYTSLKDLLPTAPIINSPTAAGAAATASGYEISIRNRLVKQAAWAYLQPMSSSPDSSGPHFLRRLWIRFYSSCHNPVSACFRFIHLHIIPGITWAFDRILRAIRVRMNR